jgi:hypothetical protein
MADNKWSDGSVSGRYQSNGLKQVIWPSLPGEVNTKTTKVRLRGGRLHGVMACKRRPGCGQRVEDGLPGPCHRSGPRSKWPDETRGPKSGAKL